MRYWFGGGVADYAVSLGAGNAVLFEPGATLECWTAQTGGTRLDDLLDAGATPVTSVVAGDGSTVPVGAVPRFQAEDEVLPTQRGIGRGPLRI